VVSQELFRVAILWHELWHEGLEEASRLYFTEKNPDGMIAALEPLHDLLEKARYFYVFIAQFNYDSFRVLKLPARLRLLKLLAGNCMKLVKLVVGLGFMVKLPSWIEHGIFTMEFVFQMTHALNFADKQCALGIQACRKAITTTYHSGPSIRVTTSFEGSGSGACSPWNLSKWQAYHQDSKFCHKVDGDCVQAKT